MFDVNKLIDGTFVAKTMDEVLEAYCGADALAQKAQKASQSAWGNAVQQARICLAGFRENPVEGLTEGECAAEKFQSIAMHAVAKGEMAEWSAKGISNFKAAVGTLRTAMERGLDLLEQDETGNFRWAGKTKIEQWNSNFEKERAERERQARVAKAAEAGVNLGVAVDNTKESKEQPASGSKEGNAQAPTQNAPKSILDDVPAELRADVEEYIGAIVAIAAQTAVTKGPNDTDETGMQKAQRLLRNQVHAVQSVFFKDFANLRKAANA